MSIPITFIRAQFLFISRSQIHFTVIYMSNCSTACREGCSAARVAREVEGYIWMLCSLASLVHSPGKGGCGSAEGTDSLHPAQICIFHWTIWAPYEAHVAGTIATATCATKWGNLKRKFREIQSSKLDAMIPYATLGELINIIMFRLVRKLENRYT